MALSNGAPLSGSRRMMLTIDEARAVVAESALAIASCLECGPQRRKRLLLGRGRSTGLDELLRKRVAEHRALTRALREDGLGWLVNEEIDGICSYTEAELGARSLEPAASKARAV